MTFRILVVITLPNTTTDPVEHERVDRFHSFVTTFLNDAVVRRAPPRMALSAAFVARRGVRFVWALPLLTRFR